MFCKRIPPKQLESNKFFISSSTVSSKLIKKLVKLKKFKLSGMGKQTRKVVEIGLELKKLMDCEMVVTTSTCQVYDDIQGLDTTTTSTRLQSVLEVRVKAAE